MKSAAMLDDEPYVLCVDPQLCDGDPLRHALGRLNVAVRLVTDASTAWALMSQRAPELALLDDGLAGEGAFALLDRMRLERRLARVPVVLQTASVEQRVRLENERGDAAFYLTKPISPEALLGIVRPALRLWTLQRGAEPSASSLELLQQGRFEFRTVAEAQSLALQLGRLCPEPERVGMGLAELMVNAVEHGNLEIGYAEKAALCREHAWQAEVERRLQLPEYKARFATLHVERDGSTLRFDLHDCGSGFVWDDYLRFDPCRAQDPNGRGIALANGVAFASLRYHPPGNRVVAEVSLGDGF